MRYFPQLPTGAVAHYPLVKRRAYRTVVSETLDGGSRRLADPGEAWAGWKLTFSALTSAEMDALEGFFSEVEGRLGDFTFLDPTDNLLARSGELSASTWAKEPLIEVADGVSDPTGGTRGARVRNCGGTTQSVQQTVDAPGWYHYCYSLFLRSDQPAQVTLFRKTASIVDTKLTAALKTWTRVSHSGRSVSAAEGVAFGIALDPGAAVEVFGMQAEAQPCPTPYRRTHLQGGVHPNARFDQDELIVVSDGPEQHACTLRILAASLPESFSY